MLITFVIIISVCLLKINKTQALFIPQNNNEKSLCNINEKILFESDNWKLEIPKINLSANINFGTSEEVMNKYIGHFDNTSLWNGNVGLAAHNRGYPVNYFGRLKELQIGDEIKYTTVYGIKTYKVTISTIIKDTDWSYLEETKDNRITLITCVENQPRYRRCIQAIEI